MLGALAEVVSVREYGDGSDDRFQEIGEEFDDLPAEWNVLREFGHVPQEVFVAA